MQEEIDWGAEAAAYESNRNEQENNEPKPRKERQHVEHAGFVKGKTSTQVFRVAGKPLGYTLKHGRDTFDPIISFRSEILVDSGKHWVPLNWKFKAEPNSLPELDKDWFWYRFMNKLTAGEWSDGPEDDSGKKTRVKTYNLDPGIETESMKWIHFNSNGSGRIPPKPWPKANVVLQGIPRGEAGQWTRENHHDQILTHKKSVTKEGKVYIDTPGVPFAVYEKIIESVAVREGGWSQLDLVITRKPILTASGKVKDYEWIIQDALDVKPPASNFKSLMVAGPLTEEELRYETYNLTRDYAVTSHYTIRKWFGKRIAKACEEFGFTGFLEELEDLCAREEAEYQKRKETPEGEDVPF